MAMTDFTIIRRSMTSRLFSTVTTVLTVAVAVGLMLVLLSMRDAGRRAFERGSGNMHLLVSMDSSPLEAVLNGIFYAKPPSRAIPWAKYQEIASIPFVGKADNPGLTDGFAIPVQEGDSYKGFPTLATTPEFFQKFEPVTGQPWRLAQGRFFSTEFEVVAGSAAAKGAGLKIGDRIVLTHGAGASREGGGGVKEAHVHTQFKFEVVGILEPTGSAHDRALFITLNSTWILHAFDRREAAEHAAGGHDEHEEDHADEPPVTVADLTDADRLITGIFLRAQTRAGSENSAVLPAVFDSLRRDPTLTVTSPKSQIDKLFLIVNNIDQVFLGMAAAVMVSSGIAIMLALYNSMEQRRRQVAVLRVLGCSRGRIFGLVLTEAALIGIFGAVLGLGLCVLGGRVVAAVMKERLSLVIQPVYGLDWILPVVVGTIVLAALAGLIPAVMAYRTSVAKNLRPLG